MRDYDMSVINRVNWLVDWRIGNESVPNIIINDTINLFFKTAVSILVVSNHNSFRVLFDKIASVYFIWKKYIHILALEMCPVPTVSTGSSTLGLGGAKAPKSLLAPPPQKNNLVLTYCGQLILRKISKFDADATRCQILKLKCTKFDFCWGSAPHPNGWTYSTPPNSLVPRGPTSVLLPSVLWRCWLGRERKGRKGRGQATKYFSLEPPRVAR